MNKKLLKKIGIIVLFIVIGGAADFILGMLLDKYDIDIFKGGIFTLIIYILLFIFGFLLQLILHEVGHLICGLWSGYEFISFRIGTLTFVKEDNKIALKKFKIIGTAGQCLMMPPKENGYACPYILYNLGGVLMNLLISSLCIISYARNGSSVFDFYCY